MNYGLLVLWLYILKFFISLFWEIVYNKCDNYCIFNFIYLISVIFLRDVTTFHGKFIYIYKIYINIYDIVMIL